MKTKKDNDIIEVFAGTSIDAEIVRSLLEDSDIKTFLKDDNMGTIAPWHVSAGGAGAVKIIINSNDYDKAKLIIEKYEESKY
jgi:hypothetical protein